MSPGEACQPYQGRMALALQAGTGGRDGIAEARLQLNHRRVHACDELIHRARRHERCAGYISSLVKPSHHLPERQVGLVAKQRVERGGRDT